MANLLPFFLDEEDEVAFFRAIAHHGLEVYPVRVPQDWKPIPANEKVVPLLPEDAAYLAASQLGPILVDRVKRGKDKGSWRVDEVRSPVIFYERSRPNPNGELVSGKLWAELDVTPQKGRRDAAPERFRQLFMEVEEWFRKRCRKSQPHGFAIGSSAARRAKQGLVLRDADPHGGTVRPWS